MRCLSFLLTQCHLPYALLYSLLTLALVLEVADARPNIVLFLTDDQDLMLGGGFPLPEGERATPLRKTQQLLVEEGLTATNFFVHTPICCPSRSELLTGRYFHNIKANAHSAGGKDIVCMHVNETLVNNHTFAKHLQAAGYTVGLFGKYLNKMPPYVPEGFDAWLANGGGTYHNPEFVAKGVPGIKDGDFKTGNYSTSAIGNATIRWIESVAGKKPFFAYVAPKAAHEPFNPAPWYEDYWAEDWPSHEPRPPIYNCSSSVRADHHGNIATQPLLTEEAANVVTGAFKNRWRTLMSVDDLISQVIQTTKRLNVFEKTYFFFTSDNGFQLGQFNMLMDKRHVYDWNTRVPFIVAGPGIPKGETFSQLATQVDLAPTFLDLAGIMFKRDLFDGRSLVPLIISDLQGIVSEACCSSSTWLQPGRRLEIDRSWRRSVFFEYYFNTANTKCVQGCNPKCSNFPGVDDLACGILSRCTECWCDPREEKHARGCYRTEDVTNNYIAIRTMGDEWNFLYAEFSTGDQNREEVAFERIDFVEVYNVSADPWMMRNLRDSLPQNTLLRLHNQLRSWYTCRGLACP